MRKKLLIRCIFTDSSFINESYNIIIKRKNKVVFNGLTDSKGLVEVELCSGRKYDILVSTNNMESKILTESEIVTTECHFDNLYFVFTNKTSTTFNVTDKFYSGLPVAKGELILCHNT